MQNLSIEEMRVRLAKLLYERSYREGKFILTSGRESDFYFDGKQTALHPEGAFLIGHLFNHIIKDNTAITAVGGLTLGADPLDLCLLLLCVKALKDTAPINI